MTLAQVTERLDDYDDQLMIWARARGRADLTPDTEAVVAPELEDGGVWWNERGLMYVLEVDLAKDAIRVWRQDHGGAEPSAAQRCTAVLYYAVNDAFLKENGSPMGPDLKRDLHEANLSWPRVMKPASGVWVVGVRLLRCCRPRTAAAGGRPQGRP
jgi:hypothetical protein